MYFPSASRIGTCLVGKVVHYFPDLTDGNHRSEPPAATESQLQPWLPPGEVSASLPTIWQAHDAVGVAG